MSHQAVRNVPTMGYGLGVLAVAGWLVACSSSSSDVGDTGVGVVKATGGEAGGGTGSTTATGSGGATGTGATTITGSGGATGTGGQPPSGSGGRTNSGGAAGTGGRTNSGGAAGTGGRTGSGGATGSGGRTSSGGAAGTGGRTGTGGATSGGSTGSGGATGSGGRTGTGGATSGGSTGSGGATGSGGRTGTGGATSGGSTGSSTIPTHCSASLPPEAQPVDVSKPTSVIGTGTAASCTFDLLAAAVKKGGIITFDCGTAPVTIPITATLNLITTADTVIDGGGTITLDGQKRVQIMNYNHGDFMKLETRVTLQHLSIINGKTTPTVAIPTAPEPCSQGYNDGQGGALFMRDGNLTIIDCTFSGNQGAPRGPDTGGGAIYINASKHGALIVNSVFTNNQAANAGAVGALFATLNIYNSMFRDNKATGDGANYDDATKCDVINNGQHEVGSGGNGGAIYQDGASSTNVLLCGVDVENNAAGTGAFGGGVFMTSNDFSGTITVQDSIVTGNTGGSWTQVNSGPGLGTAFGVNAKSSTVINSTLQGVK